MPWRCPLCGAENPDEADVCLSCGAPRPQPGEGEEHETPRLAEPRSQQAQQEEPGQETAPQPAEKQYMLEVIDSPVRELIGKRIPLLFHIFPRISIGKSPENIVIIPDATISRRHAVIEKRGDKLYIQDLGSTNGTYIYNEDEATFKKIDEAEIKPGTLLRLGMTTLRLITD